MKEHVSDEELFDLATGAEAARSAHLAACEACSARVREARELLTTVRGVEVPEPPALFWQAFRRQVERRIAEERPRPRLLTWLLPAAAVAVLAAAVAVPLALRGRPEPSAPPEASPASVSWSALPPAEEDEALAVLQGVAASGGEIGWDEGRGLGAVLAELSDEESAALAEALAAGSREVKL